MTATLLGIFDIDVPGSLSGNIGWDVHAKLLEGFPGASSDAFRGPLRCTVGDIVIMIIVILR